MLNRPRRRPRGWRQRVVRREPPPDSRAPGLPVRALPARILLTERYFYHWILTEPPHATSTRGRSPQGEILVLLPIEDNNPALLGDIDRHMQMEAGDLGLRVGWLAFSMLMNTDLATQLGAVRPWHEPTFTAFPLVFRAVRASDQSARDLVTRGSFGFERLVYHPKPVVPYPVSLRLFVAHDANAPLGALPDPAPPDAALPRPERTPALEWVLHGHIDVKIVRPSSTASANLTIRLARLEVEWPVPLVPDQVRWLAPEVDEVNVDSRGNRLVVEGVPVRFDPTATGLVEGRCTFAIAIRRPALLPPTPTFRGRMMIEVGGILLSEVQAQYFDASGYLRATDTDGAPLVQPRNELHVEWVYSLEGPSHLAPHILERRYTWRAYGTLPELARDVEAALLDRGYRLDPALTADYDIGHRWWAQRELAGQPLTLDLRLKREGQPASLAGDHNGQLQIHDLLLRAHYRGDWQTLSSEVEALEMALRVHLQQRLRESPS